MQYFYTELDLQNTSSTAVYDLNLPYNCGSHFKVSYLKALILTFTAKTDYKQKSFIANFFAYLFSESSDTARASILALHPFKTKLSTALKRRNIQEICSKLDTNYKRSTVKQQESNFSAKMRTRLTRILPLPWRASNVSRVHKIINPTWRVRLRTIIVSW